MKHYELVLLKDNHPTEGFAEIYFRNAEGEPRYIQEDFNGRRWGMYGYRDCEEFTAKCLCDLILQLYRADYVINDPFDIIATDHIYQK